MVLSLYLSHIFKQLRIASNLLEIASFLVADASHKETKAHPHLVIRLINVKCECAQHRFCTARFAPSAFLPENNSDHAHGAGFLQPHHNNAMLSNNKKKYTFRGPVHLSLTVCTYCSWSKSQSASKKYKLKCSNIVCIRLEYYWKVVAFTALSR